MRLSHVFRSLGIGATVVLLLVAIRLGAEQVAQEPLEAIIAEIPDAWYEGGWDQLDALQRIVAENPDDVTVSARAQFYIGAQHYANREHEQAIQAFRTLIDTYPSAWLECQKAQFEIGQIYLYRLDDPSKAIPEYEQAMTRYPDSFMVARAHLMLARAYRRLDDRERALVEYRALTDRHHAHRHEVTEAQIDVGSILMNQAFESGGGDEELQGAISAFKIAYLSSPPEDVELMTQALDGIYQSFRALDSNLVRATAVIAYQRYGSAGQDRVIGTEDDLIDPLQGF